MARKKDKGPAPGPPPTPGWLNTYGDMITNMLCFFVLMMAMARFDDEKVQQVTEAIQSHFSGSLSFLTGSPGILSGQRPTKVTGDGGDMGNLDEPGDENIPESRGDDVDSNDEPNNEAAAMLDQMAQIMAILDQAGLAEQAELKPTERGLIVRFASSLLFTSGSAILTTEALQMLNQITPALRAMDNALLIEGHTCDLPINTPEYPNNWYLSNARAAAVVSYLQDRGIEPWRMSAVGHSEYQNIVPNNSEANRQRNRRVDIVIVSNGARSVGASEAKTDR